MNKYALLPIYLLCLSLVFSCTTDSKTDSTTETVEQADEKDIYGTNRPADMSQEMKNLDAGERQALDKIAELQKKALEARKASDAKKQNPNERTYLIGLYETVEEARDVQEEIYRIQYKIKPVLERAPGSIKVMAKCRFKDKEELAKMEKELKNKFGSEVRLLANEIPEASEG